MGYPRSHNSQSRSFRNTKLRVRSEILSFPHHRHAVALTHPFAVLSGYPTTNPDSSTTMYVLLKRLVGLQVEKQGLNLNVDRIKKIKDCYINHKGLGSIKESVERTCDRALKRLRKVRARKARLEVTVQEAKEKLANSKENTSNKKCQLQSLKTQIVTATIELQAAARNEDDDQQVLTKEEEIFHEVVDQEKKILEDVMVAENNVTIVKALVKQNENKETRAKLPLGEESGCNVEDLREAVADLVPTFSSLCNQHRVRLSTIRKALRFLHLLGVDEANTTIRANSDAILRVQLAQILWPQHQPPREPSLSPESKDKLRAEELWADAEKDEMKLEGKRRAAKTVTSEASFEEPPKKRHKASSLATAKERLGEELFKELFPPVEVGVADADDSADELSYVEGGTGVESDVEDNEGLE